MTSHTRTTTEVPLRAALRGASSSARLQVALAAGSRPDPRFVEPLVERCAVEPDFFVRDMLTWALTRHDPALTVPRLLTEARTGVAQARSQALHTLSKIGDARGWGAVSAAVLHDPDDEVARSAWRAAVALVPAGHEAALARELCTRLGQGDPETRRSLSRALAGLGEVSRDVLRERASVEDPDVRTHALATELLLDDPDAEFEGAVAQARRAVALAAAPAVPDDAVPGDAVPGDAVPGDAVPGDAVPGDAVPDDAVPDDAVPDDAVPGDAVPAPAHGTTQGDGADR